MTNLTLTDILIERRKKQKKYFKNYLGWAKLIKREAEKDLGKVKVLVFGSILRKDEVPRDIDILIISPKLENLEPELRNEIRTRIKKQLGFLSPFEIHLISPQDYEEWYKNFIEEFIEV